MQTLNERVIFVLNPLPILSQNEFPKPSSPHCQPYQVTFRQLADAVASVLKREAKSMAKQGTRKSKKRSAANAFDELAPITSVEDVEVRCQRNLNFRV